MGPDTFGPDGVVGDAVKQEVLEEAHILQAEEWDLVLRLHGRSHVLVCRSPYFYFWGEKSLGIKYLVDDLGHRRIFALQPRLHTMTTGGSRLLALEVPQVSFCIAMQKAIGRPYG